MYCGMCGSQVSSSENFCRSCGESLQQREPAKGPAEVADKSKFRESSSALEGSKKVSKKAIVLISGVLAVITFWAISSLNSPQFSELEGNFDKKNSKCYDWTTPATLVCDMVYTISNKSSHSISVSSGHVFAVVENKIFEAVEQDQSSSGTFLISDTFNPGESKFVITGFQVPIGKKIERIFVASNSNQSSPQVSVTTDFEVSVSSDGAVSQNACIDSGEATAENAVQGGCRSASVELLGKEFFEADDGLGKLLHGPACNSNICGLGFDYENTFDAPIEYQGYVCAVVNGSDYLASEAGIGQDPTNFDTAYLFPGERNYLHATWRNLPRGGVITEIYLGLGCDSSANGYKYIQSTGSVTVR